MKKRNNLIFGMAFLILLSSCSPQNFVYWKNIQSEAKCLENERYEAIIQKDDRLSIQVSSKNPELAIPFNRQGGTFYLTEDGTVSASSEGTATVREKGYRVDVDGNIEFPILGKLHVGGLTLNEATEMIQQKIKEGNYIKSPLVSIEILNFKYYRVGGSRKYRYIPGGRRPRHFGRCHSQCGRSGFECPRRPYSGNPDCER